MLTLLTNLSEPLQAALAAGVFVTLAAVIAILPSLLAKSNLELVDVSFDTKEPSSVLDIKVRNKGHKIAYISQVLIEVEDIWELHTVTHLTAYIERSQTYDIALPVKGSPYDVSIDIDQRIPPNDVDRFSFSASFDQQSDGYNSNNDYIAKFSLILLYDSNNRKLKTKSIILAQYNGLQGYSSGGLPGPILGGLIEKEAFNEAPHVDPHDDKNLFLNQLEKNFEYWAKLVGETIERNLEFIKNMRRSVSVKNKELEHILDSLEGMTHIFAAMDPTIEQYSRTEFYNDQRLKAIMLLCHYFGRSELGLPEEESR